MTKISNAPNSESTQYPIFMFALDLEELDAFHQTIWPLSIWIANFREGDHLKNGEGLPQSNGDDSSSSQTGTRHNSISNRILRLVAQKTNNKFEPSLDCHRVVILTHLCYYGYNFNPVSFYYVINKKSNEIAAVVGEVSNTPWTEMYCYVLHPDSTDNVKTESRHNGDAHIFKKEIDYSFPKRFHVSPFMDMDFWYDWKFVGVPGAFETNESPTNTSPQKIYTEFIPITVVNTLRRRGNDRIEFTAKLVMEGHSITPFQIVWQMIKLPVFCLTIQIWIHYQAALLFLKGIVYIPHPNGSETTASRIIANIMIPFFAIRDFLNPKSKTA